MSFRDPQLRNLIGQHRLAVEFMTHASISDTTQPLEGQDIQQFKLCNIEGNVRGRKVNKNTTFAHNIFTNSL